MAETMNVNTTATETIVTNAELAGALEHLEQVIQTFTRFREQLERRGLVSEFVTDFLEQVDEDAYGTEYRFWAYWKANAPEGSAINWEAMIQDASDDEDDE